MSTYTKLRDGSWGVKVQGAAKAGQSVTVTKKSGESKTEVISRVLWSGDGVTLCAISQGSSHRRSGRGYCDECGEYATPGTRCWETGCTH